GERRLVVHLVGVDVARSRNRLVDQIRGAAGNHHHDAHHENPHQQLHLYRRLPHRENDERDERNAGDTVSLEAVRAWANRVTGVVTSAIGDHAGVSRIVLFHVENDLHQIGADVGDLGKDSAGDTERRRAQRLTDGEPDEAGTGIITRNEQQDEEHDHQLDADEKHADAHSRLQWNRIAGERLAAQAGERGARVGEGVDTNAEPRYTVAAGNTDEAEEENDPHLHRLELEQESEIQQDHEADEDYEDQNEYPLGDQIRFAGLVNQLGDLEHRLVDRHPLELPVENESEKQTKSADDQAAHQQRAPVNPAQEADL